MLTKTAVSNFMLAPMSDRYIDVILGAVAKVDTSRIEAHTSKMGTVYSGHSADVLDAVRACFSHAYVKDIHMTLTMTLSEGCPYECTGETGNPVDMASCANAEALKDIHFPVDCKFAYFPLGITNHIEKIEKIIELTKTMGVYKDSMPMATCLKGDVADIFAFFEKAVSMSEEDGGMFVYDITLSVNSPSAD